MPHLPDFDSFARLAAGHQLVPVYRRMLSDALTPVTAFALLDRGEQACLFESVVGGEKVGRYSFLAVEPFWELPERRCPSARWLGATRRAATHGRRMTMPAAAWMPGPLAFRSPRICRPPILRRPARPVSPGNRILSSPNLKPRCESASST